VAIDFRRVVTGAVAVSSAIAISLPGIAHSDTTSVQAAKRHHHHHHHHKRHHHSKPSHKQPSGGIPQHNGGDHDADNNGGPSDGDGNL
jgi:hypothetical protein